MDTGNLGITQASFHKIIKNYHNEKERCKYIIYKHSEFSRIINDIGIWCYHIRSIRTKETHYNTGEIEIKNNSIFYVNNVNYGGENKEVEFDLSYIRGYFNKFITDTKKLLDMINGYEIAI